MFFKLSQLLSFSISLFATSVASEYQDQISIESCHEDGFDPVQLACPTCDILPESVDSKCRACCQPYKTVKTQTKRYACAVLLHHDEQGMMPEIDQVYNEEVDNIQKRKGKNGFWTKTMTLGNFYRPSPSMILWFNEMQVDTSVNELQEKAAEITSLNGWKRDDARDMLLALLPDI